MKKLLIIFTLINLFWVNNRVLIIMPSTYEAKRPSVWLKESPHICWLMDNSGGHRISGLDFPFYCGHWVHLRTLGYMGGFRTKEMNKYLGGGEGTNNWKGSIEEARKYDVKYFIVGYKIYAI